MNKVRFENAGSLGLLALDNPPLNLFDEELLSDLQAAVSQARQLPLRALLVRAEGKVFSGGADVAIFKGRSANEARKTTCNQSSALTFECPDQKRKVMQCYCSVAN